MAGNCSLKFTAVIFGILLSQPLRATAHGDEPPAKVRQKNGLSYPVLMVQISNIAPGDVFVAEATVATYSGQRNRWAERNVRKFNALPANLTGHRPRQRGFAYFWNPVSADLPQLTEFWELLPGEIVDPYWVPGAERREPGDGEFAAVVHEPDRWSLNFYSTMPDGKEWVREEPALYSKYFAKNEQALWSSISPAVLDANLPPLIPSKGDSVSFDLWVGMDHVPDSLLDRWKQAVTNAVATFSQKRDAEPLAPYRLRHWRQGIFERLLETLTSRHTKLEAHVEVDRRGSTSGYVRVASETAQWIREISQAAARINRLSAIQSRAPWFHSWIGIRLPEQLQDELKWFAEEMERDPAFATTKIMPLLKHVSHCEEFQVTIAGITGPDGGLGFAVGVYSENAAELQAWAEVQAEMLNKWLQLWSRNPDIASACDQSTLWIVITNDSAGEIASQLLESSPSLGSRPTRAIASLGVNLARLPVLEENPAFASEVPEAASAGAAHVLLRIMGLLRNVQTVMHSDNAADAELTCSLESDINYLQMTLTSGSSATIGLAAAVTSELELLRARQRRESP